VNGGAEPNRPRAGAGGRPPPVRQASVQELLAAAGHPPPSARVTNTRRPQGAAPPIGPLRSLLPPGPPAFHEIVLSFFPNTG